jgi:hypothetical protein
MKSLACPLFADGLSVFKQIKNKVMNAMELLINYGLEQTGSNSFKKYNTHKAVIWGGNNCKIYPERWAVSL